jgi:RND family efflux transporter MFP subunit
MPASPLTRRIRAGLVALSALALTGGLAHAQTAPAPPPKAGGPTGIEWIDAAWSFVTGLVPGRTAAPATTPAPPPPPTVTVARPQQRELTDVDEYTGRFVATETVEVRARVSGYLDRVAFTDGQIVRRGELLFVIDQRPFKAVLDQARADLARAKAAVEFADAELDRAKRLIGQQTISEAVFEQRVQAKRQADAQMQSAEASIRRAELDMEFTELRAPISGRIGDRRVAAGNLVTGGTQGNTTLLATIVSMDPIRFEFTADEAAYLRYQRLGIARPQGAQGAGAPVRVRLIDERDYRHQGNIDFLDNVLDDTSGTIRGRAVFANTQGLFLPGMFGKLQLNGSAPFTALLVPDSALVAEQARRIVWVIDAENTARAKAVEPGRLLDGNLRVIRSGLAPDDRVVVNGVQRVTRAGLKVNPQEQPPTPAPGGAPASGQPAAAPRAETGSPARVQ